ncbi:PE-PGRS family protein [Streptosporangium nondiastaticum]|uniref:PE-PGRS family protein n=1 Tax=Streptosporangium nondiastaticum TaxID=35764 RepID=A0A9X7JNK8_9ACTN|nr:PE-PGRS family protein [Streptosporangium nondiastaticum]PSJ27018.1 PE-PGRS family protein [Streptosporangium nondiastaticum]
MRNVNPDHLDQLARLFDERGGLRDKLDEAFTRAQGLGVSDKLPSLTPMRSWTTDTPPDLRRRAAVARLESGDPTAGLKWAGFSAEDIAKAGVAYLAPDILLIANAMATSDSVRGHAFRREKNESLDDWIDRMRAHEIARIPGLEPYEAEITEALGTWGDIKNSIGHGGRAAFYGVYVPKTLLLNSLAQGYLQTKKLQVAGLMQTLPNGRWWVPGQVGVWGERWAQTAPVVRNLSAPGTWLPGQLGSLASGSQLFQRARQWPVVGMFISDQLGARWNAALSAGIMDRPLFRGYSGKQIVRGLVGNDELAALHGARTHAGQIPTRAAHASLWKVGRNVSMDARMLEGKGRFAAWGEGLKVAGKTGGALRGLGVVGGVYSTGYSAANLVAQGNPAKHFTDREHGAKYVADVAEVGFNASLTAATVAPNPVTLGAVAVTGAVYVGAKTVEHWDDIKDKGGKALKWTGDKAKSFAKKANPMNWF